MSLLLKNALITDLRSPHHRKKKNIFIKNGVIESFVESSVDAKRIIDCEGKTVTPGWVDLNADFCDPGFEFKEDIRSGSLVATSGGFTDVNLLPNTNPPVGSKNDVEYIRSKASREVDLQVSASVSEGLKGEHLAEMLDMYHSGARSFSDGDLPIWNTELLIRALQYTSKVEVPVFQNARDRYLSANTQMHEGLMSTNLGLRGEPSLSEALILSRDLDILRYSGGNIHFSKISTSNAVRLIKQAKKEKLNVTCDVGIHHLLFDDSSIANFDTMYKSLPPFRSQSDRKALIKGVKDGTIDAICSNHRPQDQESKQLEFDLADSGSISLQTFLPALLKIEDIPFDILTERITQGPRRVLGLEEVSIEEESLAKLTIVDMEAKWIFDRKVNVSKSYNSPFWYQELTGRVVGTVNRDSLSMVC